MLISAIVAFFWGLFEGIWFFIVPDVALSFISIKGWKAAVASVIATVLGSMVAAAVLSSIVSYLPEFSSSLVSLWSHLPGFYPSMLDTAANHLRESQARGLLSGPTSGIPYRFYIYEAFLQKISLSSILLWTPPARLERILLAPVVVLTLRLVFRKISVFFTGFCQSRQRRLLFFLVSVYWICTYIWYWFDFLPKTYGGGTP